MQQSELQAHLDAIERDGFTILEGVFTPERASRAAIPAGQRTNAPDDPARPADGKRAALDHALFHGAADNPSHDWRLGLQVSYHAGWFRPYTNWFRSIPVEEVREFPEKLRDLLGYKTYNGIGGARSLRRARTARATAARDAPAGHDSRSTDLWGEGQPVLFGLIRYFSPVDWLP